MTQVEEKSVTSLLPAFVRDMIEFKSDQDVVITHITDTRIELRINEAFKKIDEAA